MAYEAPPLDLGLSLALAVVASSAAPVLLLDGEFAVIAASGSFCSQFGLDEAEVVGRPVFDLGLGEWDVRKLHSLLDATASGGAKIAAYEMDLVRPGVGARCLVLAAHKLDYGDPTRIRIMLSVCDVTDSRRSDKLREDLLREKEILLREVQHRVANSLQIIASVLLQSARKVQSEETRGHLRDAHNRVMSIAAVQQQLSVSTLGAVEITPYFRKLCRSLGASMIHDPKQIALEVDGDDSRVPAETSVSLGLIVTELVINALKHAFPDHRVGAIRVGYTAEGGDWKLSVSDDGVGMPADPKPASSGLGTSIVEALARHLEAEVSVTDAHPGTRVALTHAGGVDGSPAHVPAPKEVAV